MNENEVYMVKQLRTIFSIGRNVMLALLIKIIKLDNEKEFRKKKVFFIYKKISNTVRRGE